MTIGLICAIPEELTHLREILGGVTTAMVGHAEFATGTLDGHEVVLALRDVAQQSGQDWETIAAALKRQGRLHLETY